MKKGVLVVVSGFSGAGKGTVTRRLVEDNDGYALSISATSRQKREGEEEGVHYFFKTKEEFEKLIACDELIEHAQYVGNYYGTPKKYVEECLNKGMNVILEIEVVGALQVKKKYPDAMTVFMTTKDAATLKKRLVGRGTETPEKIEQRLKRAVEEAEYISSYDFILVNDDLDRCIEELKGLVESWQDLTGLNDEFIDFIKEDFKKEFS
ncbi:MAG: guanylate kinase [Lachnospiraceae bacterium]|nr:guanylate kinase [Lachnospiraceae bacterium]MCR4927637.1 guanylate kinase [Lachnospiraceae bacterium]